MGSPEAYTLSPTDIRTAIADVMDPCSLYNGSNIPLLDLGMIRDVTVDDRAITIELFLDDPSCVYVSQIMHELGLALEGVRGDRETTFIVVADEVWTPDRLSDRARARAAAMHERLAEALAQYPNRVMIDGMPRLRVP
jgi:metal-sulfur cluster biosynthetic enzyme